MNKSDGYFDALKHYKNNDLIRSLKCCDERLADNPNYAPLKNLKRKILFKKSEPNNKNMKLLIAELENNNHDAVIKKSKIILADYPISLFVHQLIARSYLATGKYEDAIYHFDVALIISPASSEILSLQASSYLKLKRYSEAQKSYSLALALKPDDISLLTGRASAYIGNREYVEAEIDLKTVFDKEPKNFALLINLGGIAAQTRRFVQALEYYKLALELRPNDVTGLLAVASLLQISGQFSAAIEVSKKILSLEPKANPVYRIIAECYYEIGDLKEALIWFELYLEIQDNAAIKAEIFQILIELGNESNIRNFLTSQSEQVRSSPRFKLIEFLYSDTFIKTAVPNVEHLAQSFKFRISADNSLVAALHDVQRVKFDNTLDKRYGDGSCSDYLLFEIDNINIQNYRASIIHHLENIFGAQVFVADSFVNISCGDSGISSHDHIMAIDRKLGLQDYKYSAVHYIDVGDQSAEHPGFLTIHQPTIKLLPQQGEVIVFRSDRKHEARYTGLSPRVMIGINFYIRSFGSDHERKRFPVISKN